jgi:hypothetical protein
VISRRSISLLGFWLLAIAIPTSYSKGRAFEGRKLHSDGYIQNDPLNSWPVVFARTIVGGEPEILRLIAGAGLLLTGVCVISLGFDFAPRKKLIQPVPADEIMQKESQTVSANSTDLSGIAGQIPGGDPAE